MMNIESLEKERMRRVFKAIKLHPLHFHKLSNHWVPFRRQYISFFCIFLVLVCDALKHLRILVEQHKTNWDHLLSMQVLYSIPTAYRQTNDNISYSPWKPNAIVVLVAPLAFHYSSVMYIFHYKWLQDIASDSQTMEKEECVMANQRMTWWDI